MRLKPGEATPISSSVRALRHVREAAGRPARACVVSDGTPADPAPLLAESDVVLVRPGCTVSDLLVLAKARVLPAYGSSSFSAWGSFLRGMPAASHPGRPLSAWGLPNRVGDPPRVELELESLDAHFLTSACEALAAM